jgi:uroporphyrinogen-III synthase
MTVAITRPKEQAEELANMIIALGGVPRLVPTLEIKPLKDLKIVKDFVRKIDSDEADMVIFLSINGVENLITASKRLGLENQLINALKRLKVIAIGPKTKKKLDNFNVSAITPYDYSSSGILKMLNTDDLRKKTIFLPRASGFTDYLKQNLEKKGANVFEFTVYESNIPSEKSKALRLIYDLSNKSIDIITFTSSGAALNLFQIADGYGLLSDLKKSLNYKVIVVPMGSSTCRTLKESGIKVHVVPHEHTIEGMINALQDYIELGRK